MRLGRDMTGITRKSTLITAITLAILAAASPRAEAESTGIVVVIGKAAAHERTIIESAIASAVRKASWSLRVQPFSQKDLDIIAKCLGDDFPWHCLSPLMDPQAIDRLVVADVSLQPNAPGKLTIKGQLVIAGDKGAAVSQQRCDGCNAASLASAAQQLTEKLLHDIAIRNENTMLELQTVPPGATVSLDGQSIGTTNAAGTISLPTYAGPHKLTVQRTGYVFDERTIDLPAGQTTKLTVKLQPEGGKNLPLAPLAFAGAGALGMVGGGILIYVGQQDGPNDRRRYTRATPLGVVTGIAGITALGIGAYLWWRGPKESAPIASPTSGGVIIGWMEAF